ncbi:hypothetical protein Mal64_03110 [Pseudobythopirellula maris]|uniref:Uncharacterized protein n=1 Tax=Pseudobythopirellula maris TaxID=2527991 RepID=A0A5C5ZR14_9BACT|nr:hypothetical protein [Pseudobythopirellula maris]TWT89929.1 hypothetical protein Mal64_03110 [Pseudobythopirellula maris]
MLFPRFSLRTFILIVTCCAAFFVVVGQAVSGHVWAWGVTVGLVSVLLSFLVQALFYLLMRLVGGLGNRHGEAAPEVNRG